MVIHIQVYKQNFNFPVGLNVKEKNMLLSEAQTKYYLTDLISHYDNIRQDAVTREAEYKLKAFEAMKIVLFGDEYNGNKRETNT